MDKPLNVAIPFTAATVTVPERAPGPPALGVPGVILNVTELVSVETVLPAASLTSTTGWLPNAVALVELLGEIVNRAVSACPTR